jgi:Zn-dependent M28 family amino/carboxypeptidase
MSTAADFDWAGLEGRLRGHVTELAGAPRPPGSRAHRRARDYVAEGLRRAGFAVEAAEGESPLPSPCVNLLTPPLPDKPDLPLFVVGAHYDSTPATPGADDNASAVAALIELAEWIYPLLKAGGLSCRLQLAAYDLEEYGLVGSGDHARRLRAAKAALRGMVSLEMLGYTDRRPGSQGLPPHLAPLYPNVGDFIGVCGNEASRGLLEAFTRALKGVAGLPVEFIAVPGRGELLPETRLSDHSSFWDAGFPALMITDTSFFRNPHYHQPTDTPETLDYPFLAKVTAGVCRAVRDVLGAA